MYPQYIYLNILIFGYNPRFSVHVYDFGRCNLVVSQ